MKKYNQLKLTKRKAIDELTDMVMEWHYVKDSIDMSGWDKTQKSVREFIKEIIERIEYE